MIFRWKDREIKVSSICTWRNDRRKTSLSISILHWMWKGIKGYIWKTRMLPQRALQRARRSFLGCLGDRWLRVEYIGKATESLQGMIKRRAMGHWKGLRRRQARVRSFCIPPERSWEERYSWHLLALPRTRCLANCKLTYIEIEGSMLPLYWWTCNGAV